VGYFRFQRIGIGSFGRINISKGGVSPGIGARGSWLTVGKRGCARRLAHRAPGCRGPNRRRGPRAHIPPSLQRPVTVAYSGAY
jgi:hypothetical protein